MLAIGVSDADGPLRLSHEAQHRDQRPEEPELVLRQQVVGGEAADQYDNEARAYRGAQRAHVWVRDGVAQPANAVRSDQHPEYEAEVEKRAYHTLLDQRGQKRVVRRPCT